MLLVGSRKTRIHPKMVFILMNTLITNSTSTDHYDADGPDNSFILKRIMVERSGPREKHFGELFLNAYNISGSSSAMQTSSSQSASSELDLSEEGLKHIARYIEYFESRYGLCFIMWVYLYQNWCILENSSAGEKAEKASHGHILCPSKWWTWLKTTESENMAVENMVICLEDIKSGRCLKSVPNGDPNFKTKMRIMDFSSALDEFTVKHLYGTTCPSRYDMWSVGVVMLEMILGSPDVFEISPVTLALLDQHIRGWSENFKELAYTLRSLMEMCILIPGSSLKHGGASSKRVKDSSLC